MGIADRDWYRDELRRREGDARSFDTRIRPPPSSDGSLGLATWIVVIGAVFASAYMADKWKAKHDQRLAPVVRPSVAQIPSPPERLPSDAPPPRSFEQPRIQAVAKCVANGKTSYTSGSECLGAYSSIDVGHGSDLEGGFSQYQLRMLRSADARIAQAQQMDPAGPAAMAGATDSTGSCAILDQQIKIVDARARHPHSAYAQDALRQERVRLTSRQFALRC